MPYASEGRVLTLIAKYSVEDCYQIILLSTVPGVP